MHQVPRPARQGGAALLDQYQQAREGHAGLCLLYQVCFLGSSSSPCLPLAMKRFANGVLRRLASERSACCLALRALNHQAKDKLLPKFILFLAGVHMTEIVALPTISVHLSGKNLSCDHGNMKNISVSPGMSVLLFQTPFKCSPQ